MTLVIDVPPELHQKLTTLASRQGVEPSSLARRVLEDGLASLPQPSDEIDQVGDDPVAAFFRKYPRRSAAGLLEMARRQGVKPHTRFQDLIGEGVAAGDEFDADAFLGARREWQHLDDRGPRE